MSLGKWDLVGVMNARKALAVTRQVRTFVILFYKCTIKFRDELGVNQTLYYCTEIWKARMMLWKMSCHCTKVIL